MKEKEEEKYDLLSKEHASMHSEIDPNHPDETTQPNLNNNPTADISLESPSRTVEYKLLPTKDNLLKEKGANQFKDHQFKDHQKIGHMQLKRTRKKRRKTSLN
ncbi:unnamed protein product [Ilex paraguariensis]|uniref:Uncharacterized protein n=1 Tax=Ilex paraguariensis TaxID=185542 RepID=A0ABC8V152_9AQUA